MANKTTHVLSSLPGEQDREKVKYRNTMTGREKAGGKGEERRMIYW